MSCTSCNKSNCSCSDNCPNKASDITVFDCDSLNVIEVPCDASLCDVIGLLEAYTTNMVNELSEMTSVVIGANCLGFDPGTYSVQQIVPSLISNVCIVIGENCLGLDPGTYSIQEVVDAINVIICNIPEVIVEAGNGIGVESEVVDNVTTYTISLEETIPEVIVEAGNGIEVDSVVVGDVTTYTVSTLGAMRASGTPSNLPIVAPNTGIGLYTHGVTQLIPEAYDDDNAYNPATGVWTCPATGRYNLSFFVHVSSESIGFSEGMLIAGITASNSNTFYCVNTATFNQANRHADIAGTGLGLNFVAGETAVLKILNTTNVNYSTLASDSVRLVIQRVM
jgi:hypothetical protein